MGKMIANRRPPAYLTRRGKPCRLSIILAALMLVGTALGTGVSADNAIAWRRIGPGGGGGTENVTIDPHDPEHVICNSDMTGGYVTFNGGERWHMFNLWSVPTDFAFVPGHKGRVYASSRGYLHGHDRGAGISMLNRSDDGGLTWEIVFPRFPVNFDFRAMQSDHRLPSDVLPGAIDGSIDKIAVDPSHLGKISIGCSPLKPYIGGNDKRFPGATTFIHTSRDGGRNWSKKISMTGEKLYALSIIPEIGGYLTITDRCIAKITNAGKVFENALPADTIIDAAITHDGSQSVIYLLAPLEQRGQDLGGGLLKSSDLGRNWSSLNGNLKEIIPDPDRLPEMSALGVSPTNPSVLYLSLTTVGPGLNREPFYSIYRSEDGGAHWSPAISTSGKGKIAGIYEGGWLDEDYPSGWAGSPRTLSVAPTNSNVCYATDNGRIYRTHDGGESWHQVYTNKAPTGAYRSTGIDVTTTYGVHFDPFQPDHFMVSYTDVGLFRTEDSGDTWHHAITGIPQNWRNTCYWVAYDPDIPGRVYSAWGRIHDLPRAKMFHMPSGFDWAPGGVAISDNGGREWRVSTHGLPQKALCTHILVDRKSSKSERVLYVCVFGKGVFRSRNGGWSWEGASEGLGSNRFVWEIAQSADGKLYLLVVGNAAGDKPLKGAVYVSSDQARSWQPLKLPEGLWYPAGIAGDPSDGETMYLTAWPDSSSGKDRFGGVYGTEDGGKSWLPIFNDAIRVNGIAVNPENRNVLVVNTFHNAAYISKNTGRTWSRLPIYDFKWGQRAFFHPKRPGQLFLTTYGASVFTTELQ